MIAIYEMSLDDENKESINIEFPIDFDETELVLNSYTGLLKLGKDWEYDKTRQVIVAHFKMKAEEIIEIFRIM